MRIQATHFLGGLDCKKKSNYCNGAECLQDTCSRAISTDRTVTGSRPMSDFYNTWVSCARRMRGAISCFTQQTTPHFRESRSIKTRLTFSVRPTPRYWKSLLPMTPIGRWGLIMQAPKSTHCLKKVISGSNTRSRHCTYLGTSDCPTTELKSPRQRNLIG